MNEAHAPSRRRRRKLRCLVISAGGERRDAIGDMFSRSAAMRRHFEPPVFFGGVPSRGLRSRGEFFRHAGAAGLLPAEEWEVLREQPARPKHPDRYFDCLEGIPVTTDRRGSDADKQLHYSVELWRKSKALNRDRAVLGCTLAHLAAMGKFTSEQFDVMLEDNVRAPVRSDGLDEEYACQCADRIWETISAVREWEEKNEDASSCGENGNTKHKCHYLYFGCLGSRTNLEWINSSHVRRRKFQRTDGKECSIIPFPTARDIEADLQQTGWESEERSETNGNKTIIEDSAGDANEEDTEDNRRQRPGGNAVWGTYAYWISKEAYEGLLETLRKDVGAMLWKGKRMRHYSVKPADKIFPRQIMARFGSESVQLPTHPAFFRAPMLTSKIHSQWDPEFCLSTDYQLRRTGLTWSDLWLTTAEREIVSHFERTGSWLTVAQIHMKKGEWNGIPSSTQNSASDEEQQEDGCSDTHRL
jgi:hypothetical protein